MIENTQPKNDENASGETLFISALKVELMKTINEFHKLSGNKQSKTAKLLGISQPKFSNISNYHIDKFSVENLIKLTSLLKCADISVLINDKVIRNNYKDINMED